VKISYKNYKISVDRGKSLGGLDNIYYSVYREKDGYCMEENFTSGDEKIKEMVKCLKGEVDDICDTCKELPLHCKCEAEDDHVGCFSYPNCDIDPMGCTLGSGKEYEPFGHRD